MRPRTVFISLACLGALSTWIPLWNNDGFSDLSRAIADNAIPGITMPATPSTGSPILDAFLRQAIFVNMPILMRSSLNPLGRPLMALFFADMTVFLAAMLRHASMNQLSCKGLFIWLFAIANLSSAVGLPVYLATYGHDQRASAMNFAQTDRLPRKSSDPPRSASASALAVLFAFTFPAWMSMDPFHRGLKAQAFWISVSVSFPIMVSVAEAGFQAASRRYRDPGHAPRPSPYIRGIFLVLALGSCLLYHHVIIGLVTANSFSNTRSSFVGKLVTFMRADWVITALTGLYSSFVALADMSPSRSRQIAVCMCVSAIVFGPGATAGLVMGFGDWWEHSSDKTDQKER